ncbi:FAD binding domain-containing protein [Clostridia bacterium]|nr:FAD binding domain-containing protein [Clostridia bacterium]
MEEQWIASETLDALLTEIADGKKTMVAGGTDLLIQMREMDEDDKPTEFADLSKVGSLRHIEIEEDTLVLGATVTYSDLMKSELVKEALPMLAQAASQVGSPQIRNRGTIGGSLANASPAADLAPIWVLLDAEVVLKRLGQKRVLLVREFLTGNKTTVLEEGELICKIRCPIKKECISHFIKVGRRNAAAIARLNGAALLCMEEKKIAEIKLVIGAATPTPLDLSDTCEVLKNDGSVENINKIAQETLKRVETISGRRASATWKFPAIENLTRRLLIEVLNKGGWDIETD